MSELSEVFEMTTKQIEPDVDAWREQEGRQRRSTRNRKTGAFAAVAAIGVAAIVLAILATRGGPETTTTITQPETVATPTKVATDFLEAFGAFDVDRASSYLADDATIASMGADDDLRLLIAWLEATGYRQTLDPCSEKASSPSGTRVRCTYDFQALRSGELGLGPYSGGAFDLIVRDGEIVSVHQGWAIGRFSPQVWEPFADWVSTVHPQDAAVMYTDTSYTNVRLSEESIRFWERRTQDYVERAAR